MEKTKRWFKNNLLFFVSIVILILSLTFSAVIFYNFRIQANDFNTRVAHIYLGDDDNQYQTILENAYDEFSDQADYKIVYQNHTYNIDFDFFDIATDDIIEVLVDNQNNHAYFDVVNESELIAEISETFGDEIVDLLATDSLVNAILNQLSVFNYFVTFNLENFFISSSKDIILINKTYNVNDVEILSELPAELSVNILGDSTFSALEAFSEFDFENETLSYLSSIILDLTLESHFRYYMFYETQTDPSWLETDVAVEILRNNDFDLEFTNSYSQAYSVEMILDGSTLNVNLIGSPYINSFELTMTSVSVPYDTITEEDLTLTDPLYIVTDDETQTIYQKLETAGQNGQIIRYIRTETYTDTTQSTYELFILRTQEATNEIISENIVEKAGN